jgi:hypothetical protein
MPNGQACLLLNDANATHLPNASVAAPVSDKPDRGLVFLASLLGSTYVVIFNHYLTSIA